MKASYLIFCLILLTYQNIYSQTGIQANNFSKDKVGLFVRQDSVNISTDSLRDSNNFKRNLGVSKGSFDGQRVLIFGVFGFLLGFTTEALFYGGTSLASLPTFKFPIGGAIIGATIGIIFSPENEESAQDSLKKKRTPPNEM